MNEMAAYEPLPISIERGAAIARSLRDYLRQARMTVRLPRGGEHVRIEGWQVLCHMCGLPLPSIVSLRREDRGESYAYIAEAMLEYGGREYRAYGICASDEPNWRGKPEFQLASMAQTRAAGKVLRLLLGWIVTLAGYEPTPAEEMTYEPEPTPAPVRSQGREPELQPPADAPTPALDAPDEPEPTAGNGHDHDADEQRTLLRNLRAHNPQRYHRILRALQAKGREVFGDDAGRRAWLQQSFGVRSFIDLTVAQAREAMRLMEGSAQA